MKRFLVIAMVFCLAAGVVLVGCGPKKAETSQAAIKEAQNMKGDDQKVAYLMQQADLFLKEKNFQEAINLSQYVLWNVDADSKQAKVMLREAKDAMAVDAQLKKSVPAAK